MKPTQRPYDITTEAEGSRSVQTFGRNNGGGFGRSVVNVVGRKPKTPDLENAFIGPAGDWAKAVSPYIEADPVGILVTTLLGFGNALNRNPYFEVGPSKHHLNEFALLIGTTSTARKGEGMETGLLVVEQADDIWSKCVVSGFGSGEVVVEHVRDPLLDDHGETLDPGAPDKRAFVYEGEFAQILTVTGREKSTLSSLLRNAWDGTRPLSNLTKRSKLRATNAHISILAGITPTELRASMSEVEIHGGFLNRFLLVYVERKHLISRPQGIPKAVVTDHADEIKRAIEFGRNKALLRSDGEAEDLFDRAYRTVLSVERPGLLGAACSRAESHVLRLAAIYSLLDQSETIKKKHVAAALALWRYCEASAALVFGEDAWSGEADLLLNELIDRGEMSRTEIRDHYQRNKKAEEIEAMLRSLLSLDLIEIDKQQTNGRAREVVRPKRHDNLVIHRDADCTSTRGWVAHDGVVRCWDCKPPALAGEVVSEVNYSTEKEAS